MTRILVIEDDVTVSKMLEDYLESEGYSVSVAQNGALALHSIDLRRPDAIILDLMLPVITGAEVAKRLRLDPDTRDIPILSVTAVEGSEDLAEILMVDAVVSKPFSLETVSDELSRLLDRKTPEEPEDTPAPATSTPGE